MTKKKLYSLIFVRKDLQILLGLKKRGFGEGKWNGFGGKIEANETIEQGTLRELKEESGLIAKDLKKIGFLKFEFEEDLPSIEVHVFETYNFEGELTESDEMQPQWFDIKNIPFDEMWLDDAFWYPYMLRNETFKAYFRYKGFDKIIDYKIEKADMDTLKDIS